MSAPTKRELFETVIESALRRLDRSRADNDAVGNRIFAAGEIDGMTDLGLALGIITDEEAIYIRRENKLPPKAAPIDRRTAAGKARATANRNAQRKEQ